MFKKLLWCLTFFGLTATVYAQKKDLDKANKKFEVLAFIDAQKLYLKMADNGYESAELFSKLGDTYYFNDDLKEAVVWYDKLFAKYKDQIGPEYYFRYAQSLKSVKRYSESNQLMTTFNSFQGYDIRANKYAEEPNYLQLIDFQSGRFIVENAKEINSYTSEFGPAFYHNANKIVFASSRDSSSLVRRKHSWNNQPFLQLFTAIPDSVGVLSQVERMGGKINTKFHESTPAFTQDGKTMYFTRNNYVAGKYKEDLEGINRLKILKTDYKNGRWTNPVELPFNNDEYSVAHPALSPDGKRLYFSSDMPGSVGYDLDQKFAKSDLWFVEINEDGTYSEPENLGIVNTSGRETFPFVSKNNVLYFASSGHQGLGGLDIFASTINADGNWSKPVNIGKPINSPKDDFAFIVDDETSIGYFSSNRPKGEGDDDIYRFIQTEDLRDTCEIVLEGTVTDETTGEPMDMAVVSIRDDSNQKVAQMTTKADGAYSFKLECGSSYFVQAEKADYTPDEEFFTTPEESNVIDIALAISLDRIPVVNCDDLAQLLDIEEIYFDFDKSNIRPDAAQQLAKVKSFMELYPDTSIDIRSHTDSRANDDYNDQLSERRAQSTRQWLIDNGIDPSRLQAKGYGEQRLVNECSNGVSCSEEAHQLNRRSEFIVSGLGQFADCD
ncbi:OmpA family protein [Nonlabens xiamenensis]|uniref:OmpA family protein n=1 Tax=Nonlabens xiamenensis TaxID=2341043 RepID=UPI000F609FA2|nr:OmpA family protein [Nonlabens xiamenensis]